jgi:tight adherence protein C
MDLNSALLLGLIFSCVATFVLAIGSLTHKAPTKQRLARLSNVDQEGVANAAGFRDRFMPDYAGDLFARFAVWATPEQELANTAIRRRMIEAGFRKPRAVVIYTVTRTLLSLMLPLLALMYAPIWTLDRFQIFTILGAAVVCGRVIPSHWVDHYRAKRQNAIIIGLPDALDLMVVCVEAGLGIQASLARIARELHRTNPILSEELELVTFEARAGKSTTEALRSLADRSGVSDVSSLVAMLVQTERFGTSLADTLRVQADSLRVRRMQRAEELAGKAPLKMMFPTLLIFAATLLVTLGPGLLTLLGFFEETNRR